MSGSTIKRIEGGRRVNGFPSEQQPVVSIITAVYNGAATLEDTIASVVSQTYSRREYIIIDGGSTDGTIDILKKYDYVIDYWISEPDKGVYDAFNKGIDLAKGEWLNFIGADDKFVDEGILQRVISASSNSKFLYGNVIWGETGKIYDGKFYKYKICRQNICQQAIFYHKSLFEKIGKFDMKYPLMADWFFNMLCFADKYTKPKYIDEVIVKYSTNGISNTKIDIEFNKNQKKLIKETFGYWYLKFTMAYTRFITPKMPQ